MSGKPRDELLLAKIQSEGYCCLNGYLRLCKARGERPVAMAQNFRIRPDIIWHHFRRLDQGKIACQQYSDCLGPIIEEIQKDKAP
jgi:hypothetical protein